ncbi:MAG: valine--tRNA ligase [Kiritimatiellaeota bacterium]|nr:valine--tRNA ligase [Kiritimatiellota bacterium]
MSDSNMPKTYEPGAAEAKWRPVWQNESCFHGDPKSAKPAYSIVIPPPNVTGILTMGHVLNNTLQDILIRRKKMMGFEVCWFPGTDHAGIATESKVEAYLREKENTGRDKLGRGEFIKRVWEWKEQYGGTIVKQLKTLGTACAWERARFTMDDGLSDAVRKVFVELYEKGLIHRGKRMINWCPASKTALSDEEVIYKDVDGAFHHFKYPLSDGSGFLEIATTRPETMLGDTAVAVNPEDKRYKNIVGKTIDLPLTDRVIPVVADEHADPEFGTGCVKITPAHDPNDFLVGQRHDLEFVNIMNDDASMNTAAGPEFEGLDRFKCRKKVVEMMKETGLLVKIEPHRHSVGYSERGDVPIEPRISEQWFVKMDELAKPAMEAVRNGDIKFHPERWTKTFFHWMENIKDWCISRQIWWGHRIPAWYNDETGETYVGVQSPEEAGKPGKWRQDEDVLDTWFSSWLWPFSIMGWPEETDEQKFFYPTNDLVTGPDIIFFWVARMIMAGIEFKGEIPFKNVYFTSIIRDAGGKKLSKSLGNSPDPLDVIEQYGADALRFSIIYIAPLGQDILYSNEKCEIGRNFANKLWNAARFRSIQSGGSANFAEKSEPAILAELWNDERLGSNNRWILARLAQTAEAVNKSLDAFRFHEAAHTLYDFVWSEFCDWYIECAKNDFKNVETRDKTLDTFDYALFATLKLLHPFMPFITEELTHQLGYITESAILADSPYPNGDELLKVITPDKKLLAGMSAKFAVVKAARNLRASYNIPPSKKIDYIFKPADAETAEFLEAESSSIITLTRAESFAIDADFEPKSAAAPSIVTDAGAVFMSLEGLVDLDAERAKLAKQKKEIKGWIKGSTAKLANEKFLAKAPPKVVEEARAKLAETRAKLARVEESLASLG